MGTHPIFESDFDCLTEKMDLELMTEAEREEYFNRDESLLERWNAFCNDSYFKHAISGVKSIPGWYTTVSDAAFNNAPFVIVYLLWGKCLSERYGSIAGLKE